MIGEMDEEDFKIVSIHDTARFLEFQLEEHSYDDFAQTLRYSQFQKTSIPRLILTFLSIFLFFPIAYLLISSFLDLVEER